jgi:hypothetical protein
MMALSENSVSRVLVWGDESRPQRGRRLRIACSSAVRLASRSSWALAWTQCLIRAGSGRDLAGIDCGSPGGASRDRPPAHRNQVREHLGFRVCSVADIGKQANWLADHVAHAERNPDRVREEPARRCRDERIELPARPNPDLHSAPHTEE